MVMFAGTTLSAHAFLKDRATVRQGSKIELNYGPLPPNDAVLANTITPTFCNTAPGCDTIPVTVIPPPIEESEDHVVIITLGWDPATRNNLQLYVWQDDEARILASGASDNNPERVILYRPEGNYKIVVHHPAAGLGGPSGPNTGYRLTLEMVSYAFDSNIFESLDPGGSFGGGSSGATADSSGAAVPEGSPTGFAPPAFAFSSGDQDFASLAGRALNTEALAGGGAAPTARVRELGSGNVNGVALGVTVGAVPVGLALAGGLFFRRRASSLLEGL